MDIENVARRPPSQLGLLKETKSLRERGYSVEEIALKLGCSSRYIATIVALLGKGEIELFRLVEAGKIPLTVAVEIADKHRLICSVRLLMHTKLGSCEDQSLGLRAI